MIGVLRFGLLMFFLIYANSVFAAARKNVGLYIGTFDPLTDGHFLVADAAMHGPVPLEELYISVNHNTAKDPNLSVAERIALIEARFEGYPGKIKVLREPLEGRPEFARYLLNRYQGKVLGAFGDDTMLKNYGIFTTDAQLVNFDYYHFLRPMTETVAHAEVYVPDIHKIEIDADGLSSSRARRIVMDGGDPVAEGVLSQRVYDLIREHGYYLPLAPESEVKARREFSQNYRAFESRMRREMPALFRQKQFAPPDFNPGQTPEARREKYVRHVVEALGLTLEQQWIFRPAAESYLNIATRSKPLRSVRKAGAFLGSFDLIGEAQRALVERVVAEHHLEDFYVGVVGSSWKTIRHPVAFRVQKVREMLGNIPGVSVHVEPVASLEESPEWFRRVANEHQSPTLAFFGSNVYAANARRLADIPRLELIEFEVPGVVRETAASPCATEAGTYGQGAFEALSHKIAAPEALDLSGFDWFADRLINVF